MCFASDNKAVPALGPVSNIRARRQSGALRILQYFFLVFRLCCFALIGGIARNCRVNGEAAEEGRGRGARKRGAGEGRGGGRGPPARRHCRSAPVMDRTS